MNAYLLSLNPDANVADQWDFGLLRDILENCGFTIFGGNIVKSGAESAVVILPARHNAEHIKEINKWLAHIKHVVLFLLGDEEAEFPVEEIDHPSIHIWVQNPHPGRHDKYHKLGTGYPPQAKLLKSMKPVKDTDVFFSGQLTHKRRHALNDNLIEYGQNHRVDSLGTRGFTQGYEPEEYYQRMVRAKIAPAPAGAVIPDSFRAYEALEAMCVLVADNRNSQGTIDKYWDWLFDEEVPFYTINETDEWCGVFNEALENYPANLHKQTAWWCKWKRDFSNKVMEQLNGYWQR